MSWHKMLLSEYLPPVEAKKSADALEVVYLLDERPDGTVMIGNSHECSKAEAIELIKAEKAKHPTHPIGVLPDDWK